MVVVKVELWPFGSKRGKIKLGELRIWNTGRGTLTRGDYGAELRGKSESLMAHDKLVVEDWPRKERHVWDLVLEVLRNLRGGTDAS